MRDMEWGSRLLGVALALTGESGPGEVKDVDLVPPRASPRI